MSFIGIAIVLSGLKPFVKTELIHHIKSSTNSEMGYTPVTKNSSLALVQAT